jgi:hypothetical protein
LFPWLKKRNFATTTVKVGKAMIGAALSKYDLKYLENKDINRIAGKIN